MAAWPERVRRAVLRRPHLVLLPLLVFVLYRPCLGLPFFWDDAANFNWMFRRPLASIWVDATGFPYYRPLGFSLWRALQLAFGPTTVLPFQLANLVTHIANALLVAGLAARFAPRPAAGQSEPRWNWLPLAAGSLMALFPFAPLAVCHTAQGFHLFVTLMALVAITSALRFRDTHHPAWAALAFAAAALAPFAHESGIVVGALMLLAMVIMPVAPVPHPEFMDNRRRNINLGLCLSACIANAAFLPWWATVPKTRPDTFTWVGWESVRQSAVFFLEGLTFPLQFPARWLVAQLGWSDIAAVFLLSLAALAVVIFVLATQRPAQYRLLLFVTAFWVISALPSIVALPFSYIIVSPRLQIFPGIAAAVLWAVVIFQLTQRLSRAAWPALGLTALVLIAPAIHIRRTVAMHTYALTPFHDLMQAVRDHPTEAQLVVNAPNWVAPVQADYALGHEGLEIMPDYVPPELLAWVNTGLHAPLEGRAFPNVFPQLSNHYFAAWGPPEDWESLAAQLPDYERVWLWQYAEESSTLLEAGAVEVGQPAAPEEFVAAFDNRIWLTEVRVELQPGQMRFDLAWRTDALAHEDIFAHVLDCSGQVLGQRDGAALGGVYPLWLWPAGISVHEVRYIPLTAAPANGCYQIEIGLFNPADGTRTPALDPNGSRLANDAVLLQP